MPSHEVTTLATEIKCSGSARSLIEFLVESVAKLTLTCAYSDHGPRVASRLLFAQRVKNRRTKMIATKASLEGNATTVLDFRAIHRVRLSWIVACSARGPRATSRQFSW